MNLPNIITLFRLLLVPLIVWLILTDRMLASFLVFIIAGVSDAIDGFIAKHFDMVTRLGTFLDPIADKMLLVSIYVTLAAKAQLPIWLTILVVSRDLLIIGGTMLSYTMGLAIRVQPLLISKVNTFAQILLAAFVLARLGFEFPHDGFAGLMVVVVAVTTVLSGLGYLMQWGRSQSDEAPVEDPWARKVPGKAPPAGKTVGEGRDDRS